jgi:hypothetical protein
MVGLQPESTELSVISRVLIFFSVINEVAPSSDPANQQE